MARSGGTLICKCLGSMKDVILLSEIHPIGALHFTQFIPSPLQQAHNWFHLLTPEDITSLNTKGRISFLDAIALIHKRCCDTNKVLVIRDWTHLDFTAVPFLPQPTYKLTTADVLRERFRVVHTATVRHPIDQWLSLRQLALLQEKITLQVFLRGYLRFAEQCVKIGFTRYEDFTKHPEAEARTLCHRLDIPYDPGFLDRWTNYKTITGDTEGTRSQTEIKTLPRRPVEPGLLDRFAQNPDYMRAISLVGYSHPF